jgi:cytochrome c-type biogenesis protein CcmH/NrfG
MNPHFMRLRITFLTILLLCSSNVALTEVQGSNQDKEVALLKELEIKSPEIVETFKAATQAFDKEQYDEAEKFFRKLLQVLPDFDPALRRLGSAIELSKKVLISLNN